MALFTVEGLTYDEARSLISSLSEVGIEANITTGGISVAAEPHQLPQAKEICLSVGAKLKAGYSSLEDRILNRMGEDAMTANAELEARSGFDDWR